MGHCLPLLDSCTVIYLQGYWFFSPPHSGCFHHYIIIGLNYILHSLQMSCCNYAWVVQNV